MRQVRTAVVAVAALIAAAVPAGANAGPETTTPTGSTATGFRVPKTTGADFRALETKAAKQETVRVIVALRVPDAVAGVRATKQIGISRAAIASVRGRLMQELRGLGVTPLKVSDDMPLMVLDADAKTMASLAASPNVVAVTEDRAVPLGIDTPAAERSARAPGTPLAAAPSTGAGTAGTSPNGYTNALPAWWDYYRVGLDRTRASGYVGAGQTVAVLDTGVDRAHPWLAGKVVAEACFSSTADKAPSGSAGYCPGGGNVRYGAGTAAPCTFSTANCWHGTHVAHTAAGAYGVASGASILAAQVFHYNTTTKDARSWTSDQIWALSWVYNLRTSYRIAAVNVSIGGGRYAGYCDNLDGTYLTGWINALRNAGIAVVIATGNDNYSDAVSSPGCVAAATSVGNTTDVNGVDAVFGNAQTATGWTGSNSNATVDLLAPGTDVCSAVPAGYDRFDGYADGMDCRYGGTSMATPHVAGAMAVIRAYRPNATVAQLEAALRASGPAVYDSRNGISRIRINVWNALSMI